MNEVRYGTHLLTALSGRDRIEVREGDSGDQRHECAHEYGYKQKRALVPKTEEKKVRFQSVAAGRDKKYEGYSLASQKGPVVRGRKDEKENTGDRKLDDEFIHNLHQHIYFLEMQLKLMY